MSNDGDGHPINMLEALAIEEAVKDCYQFLRNPTELKSIKNISLLRQQMEAQAAAQQIVAQQAAQAAVLTK